MDNTYCTFQFGFLEGKMYMDNSEEEVFVPHIKSSENVNKKLVRTVFDDSRGIIFKRDENDSTLYKAYEFIGKKKNFNDINKVELCGRK